MATKTVCPLSRDEFKAVIAKAQPIVLNMGSQPLPASPREFSTGSFGYGYSGKITQEVGGKIVTIQVNLNMTVVGSKDLPGFVPQPKKDDKAADTTPPAPVDLDAIEKAVNSA